MAHVRFAAFTMLSLFIAGCTSPPKVEPPREELRIRYEAKDADFMTVLEEIVQQGRLSVMLGAEIQEDSLSADSFTTRVGAEFCVVVDADAQKGVGTASVRFDGVSPREAIGGLAKAFGLTATDHPQGFIRLSKP